MPYYEINTIFADDEYMFVALANHLNIAMDKWFQQIQNQIRRHPNHDARVSVYETSESLLNKGYFPVDGVSALTDDYNVYIYEMMIRPNQSPVFTLMRKNDQIEMSELDQNPSLKRRRL